MHQFLTDFILDIVQNSFEAESNCVWLTINEDDRYLKVTVKDDGKGMAAEVLRQVLDPYLTDGVKHTRRKVGLGLPFLAQATRSAGGEFHIESEKGKGTIVTCTFDLCHVDTPPYGDIPTTLSALISHPAAKDLYVVRSISTLKGVDRYQISRRGLLDVLGSFSTVRDLKMLNQYLSSQEESLMPLYVDHPIIL